MAHETPEQAALAGFSKAAAARVVALHESGDYAVVYVVTGPRQDDSVSIVHRVGGSWHELTSGGGGWTWAALPDDDDEDEPVGVLALTGDLKEPATVEVKLDGHTVTVKRAEPHWAALFIGVDAASVERVVIRRLVEDGELGSAG